MELLFFLFAAIILVCSAGVVFFRNPLHCALCLVLCMTAIAGIFASLGAHFLAVVQVIVYAGAVMVLVVFVLMLLNVKDEEYERRSRPFMVIGGMSGLMFLFLVVPWLSEVFHGFAVPEAAVAPVEGTVIAIGRLLYGKYVFAFEAASILIMAALVGAVMLARRARKL